NDAAWPRADAPYRLLLERLLTKAPHFAQPFALLAAEHRGLSEDAYRGPVTNPRWAPPALVVGGTGDAAATTVALISPKGGVGQSRPFGGAYVLDALWRRLGVADAIAAAVGARRFATDVERVLFALVANRALRPFSKLAAADWASRDVHVAGLEAMDEHQAYRAMDVLAAADCEAGVQEAVFFACADLLNLEVDLLFFDTTSTYLERDEPETGPEGAPGFR